MHFARGLFLIALPLAVACGTEQQRPGVATESADTAGRAAPAPTDTGAQVGGEAGAVTDVALHSENDSGVTGDARLTANGAQTVVSVRLAGAGAAQQGIHQGHIHRGTCADLGGISIRLSPITTDAAGAGEVTTAIDTAFAAIADGEHAISYHEAGGSPGKPIACGVIPAGGM